MYAIINEKQTKEQNTAKPRVRIGQQRCQPPCLCSGLAHLCLQVCHSLVQHLNLFRHLSQKKDKI
jgi:hypothetical protein